MPDRLAENDLKPWRKDMWCIPKVDAEYVAPHGECARPLCRARPSARSCASTRADPAHRRGPPADRRPGQLERYDCEYKRNGTANLFVFLDTHRPWRSVKVIDRRAAEDFASCMRDLVDIHYPHAQRIRVVLDNLSTHSAAALYQALPPSETCRILRHLEVRVRCRPPSS